ncbi:RecX family transcriptional regulator [Spiribacter halobius]|uniref:Regulatory protein RecX n=1 Tax=Sediminicurvatus halobius TaxID=2182432 RepID=A0A2U2MVW1_9GAMM|nr:RecX family transcriptional regulator [Spiribacter halobius]
MRLLARREHSRRELARKLGQRGHPAPVIGRALDELAAENLQSDARFAEAYVRSRLERGYGPVRIEAELGERGVDAALVRPLLEADDDEWIERCREAHARRFGHAPGDLRERARQTRFLANRGFSASQIRRTLELAGAAEPADRDA